MAYPSFEVNDEEWKNIIQSLPDIKDVIRNINTLPILEGNSRFAKARVCLYYDLRKTLLDIEYSLSHAILHRKLYIDLEVDPPSDEALMAAFRYLFYMDKVPLLLYTGGEQITDLIMYMFSLENKDLEKYRKPKQGNGDRHESRQKLLAKYLKKKQSNHPITKAVQKFNTPERRKIWEFRNKWVHDKPPIIESPLVNEPREVPVDHMGKNVFYAGRIGLIYYDYTWENILNITKKVLKDFANLIACCMQVLKQEIPGDYANK